MTMTIVQIPLSITAISGDGRFFSYSVTVTCPPVHLRKSDKIEIESPISQMLLLLF